jgi:carbon-monoxide dehydrogenase large subunit
MEADGSRRGWIGRPVPRREDERFVTGKARYLDDLGLPGMGHLALVRSFLAHARVTGIDTERALAAPGVIAVLAEVDIRGAVRPYHVGPLEGGALAPAEHGVLAKDRVRYVGEPVAAVVAETRAQAEDAAELVDVGYEPLPALVDPREALSSDVQLHEAAPGNILMRWSRSDGDVEGAFGSAAHVVDCRFHIPRLAAAPIEPRGALAAHDTVRNLVTVWCSSQDAHRPLRTLMHVLGRSAEQVRVIVPDVGGAFGSKGVVGPEVVLACLAAMRLGRPVKWVEDRRENFLAAYQGRGLEADVEMAVDAHGGILAVRADLVADLGAYLFTTTPVPPVTTAMLMVGTYAIPAARVDLRGVATNKVPTGPYRGAGRPEAAFMVERMMDLVARQVGLDPLEVRRRNVIPPEAFPYRTPLGFTYDSGRYREVLDRAVELLDHDRWRKERDRARAEGRLLGMGVSLSIERAGVGGWESAAVEVEGDGRVVARLGTNPHGQGHETTFAQIVADELPVDPASVEIRSGDTAEIPRGVGTFASRSVTLGGSALVLALRQVRDKAVRIAAHLLDVSPEEVEWRPEGFVRRDGGGSLPFTEVAAAASDPANLPIGEEPGLAGAAEFRLDGPVFPYGAYGAVVEVEADTGTVRVLRLVGVDDAGRIVNPLLAEGQVVGSTAQGLGQALLEQVVHDSEGNPLTVSFLDYTIPLASDVPAIETDLVETPSPFNPLGAKGIGESGAIGAPPAIANAVMDALAPLGIRHLDFPFTSERIWRAIREHA